jgi:hypothetical protein
MTAVVKSKEFANDLTDSFFKTFRPHGSVA